MLLTGVGSLVLGQDFYDINTINVIELTFKESNWDAILDTYKTNDNDEKLLATAVVNGVIFDSVGVKYKGNSSYNANNGKNPLHIYLDYVKKHDYDGYESIKLSNGAKDPSFVREVLSYEIARKYMDAPNSNYAKVYINGSYYGLFSSSEAINADFVERRLNADKDNVRIKCNPENTFSGNGPSLEYLGADSSAYYSYYEVKSDYGWKELINFTYSLVNNGSSVENVLDIDRAIWMLAFNNVLVNLDSYTGAFRQNYYMIQDDNNRFMPIIWDLNESLGGFEMIDNGGSAGGPPKGPPTGPPGSGTTNTASLTDLDLFLRDGNTTYPLLKMIFENGRYKKMYVAHCKTMLNENFVNGWYFAKADTLQDLISTAQSTDPNSFYTTAQFTGNISSTQDNTIGITQLMTSRIAYLQGLAAFQATAPAISNIVQPQNPAPFTTVTVTAEISNATYAYVGYRHSKNDIFTKVQMFDDGAHGDGAADDGTYGVSFDIDESNTHYYIYAENNDAGIFSPERAEHEYYKIKAVVTENISSNITINEFLSSNTLVMHDNYGEYDDWVELYNNTASDISLLGYYLTDDNTNVMQYAFPDTVIPAGGYIIVWTDNDREQGSMHAGFKLSSGGEAIYLVNSNLEVVNSIEYGLQKTDYSYSRMPNGTGSFVIQGATFGFNNNETNVPASEVNSIDGNTAYNNIQLYPNPVSDILYVNTNGVEGLNGVNILNSSGFSLNADIITGNNLIEIDMSTLPLGIYVVVLTFDSHVVITKILKI